MAQLWSQKALDTHVSHLEGVRHAVHDEAKKIHEKAEGNLEGARASTTHTKIKGPTGTTQVTLTQGETDSFVNLEGDDPMAIEFGHAPSGVFDPLTYGKVTKAPHGLYILTRAAGTGDLEFVPAAGRSAGKR
jgi:hypothetical protein